VYVRTSPKADANFNLRRRSLSAGIVAKVFSASQRETLIQNPAQARNVDSRTGQPRRPPDTVTGSGVKAIAAVIETPQIRGPIETVIQGRSLSVSDHFG